MPRILGKDVKNAFNVHDPISGDVLTVYFRIPTPAERQAYDSDRFQREGKNIRIRVSEARQKWGGEILTGIKEGCFLKKLDDGTTVVFSSAPGSPLFDPKWKELILEQAMDIVEALAGHVFDGLRVWSGQEGFEEYDEKNDQGH